MPKNRQTLIGTNAFGNEYEFFIGHRYQAYSYIEEVNVSYLPNTKIVVEFSVE
jgi:hypothetical protein